MPAATVADQFPRNYLYLDTSFWSAKMKAAIYNSYLLNVENIQIRHQCW